MVDGSVGFSPDSHVRVVRQKYCLMGLRKGEVGLALLGPSESKKDKKINKQTKTTKNQT